MGRRSGGQCNPVPEGSETKVCGFHGPDEAHELGRLPGACLKGTLPKRAAWEGLTKGPSGERWTAGKPEAEGCFKPFPNTHTLTPH